MILPDEIVKKVLLNNKDLVNEHRWEELADKMPFGDIGNLFLVILQVFPDLMRTMDTIPESAFRQAKEPLGVVTIPSNVRKVSDSAFFRAGISDLEFQGSYIEIIGGSAFERNPELTHIILPERVDAIYTFAFSDNANLSHVTLPKVFYELQEQLFTGTTRDLVLSYPGTKEEFEHLKEYRHRGWNSLGNAKYASIHCTDGIVEELW